MKSRRDKIHDLEKKYSSLIDNEQEKLNENEEYPKLNLKEGDWVYSKHFKTANKIKYIKNDHLKYHFTECNGLDCASLRYVENKRDAKTHRYATLEEIEKRLSKETALLENKDKTIKEKYSELNNLKKGDWVYSTYFKKANKIKSINKKFVNFYYNESNGISGVTLNHITNKTDSKNYRYATSKEIEDRLFEEINNLKTNEN
mgnify:CR=1 FL=1